MELHRTLQLAQRRGLFIELQAIVLKTNPATHFGLIQVVNGQLQIKGNTGITLRLRGIQGMAGKDGQRRALHQRQRCIQIRLPQSIHY